MTSQPESLNLLLVDDDTDAAFLMERSIRKAGLRNPLTVVSDGEKAMRYLRDKLARSPERTALPLVIFLDLNMPRVNGFELLAWMRNQPRLQPLIKVVVTSSEHQGDVRLARELGAHAFLRKGPSPDHIRQIADTARASLNCEQASAFFPADLPFPTKAVA